MSSLTRWDPFGDMTSLRDAMNQLMESAVLRPGVGFGGALGATAFGQMNVFESKNRYICQVLLPGVSTEGIDLTVRQNTLTVKAKLPELFEGEALKEATTLLREFGSGEFTRSISLPKDVDGEGVSAQLEHGVLTIAIPLAQHAQPRRIQISHITEPTQRVGAAEPAKAPVLEEHPATS